MYFFFYRRLNVDRINILGINMQFVINGVWIDPHVQGAAGGADGN